MMMAFGRILRLHVIILVVWLGRITANPQESFKLFRDIHDVFSNSECLPGVSSGSSTCSSQSCSKFDAKCKLDTKKNLDCSYCVCNKGGRNTYMEDENDKECVKDEDIADCYKFGGRTYLQFFSHDECSGSCYYNFTNNRRTRCSIDWSKSKYLRRGKDWNPVTGANTYFTVTRLTNQRDTKILKVNNAFNIWNGSLVKLAIKCKNKKLGCVLLKFESLPKYSQVTPTSSTWPPSSSTKPTTKHHTAVLSSKSEGLSIESSSTKAIAISVPIIVVIIILCLVLGFFFIRMKRKRREPELTRNEEEMQSRETPNSPTNIYEDPSQMYESLKEDRREPEQPYQGLVGLDSQGNDTSVYDYIDEKDITNPEGEYSYASNNNLARPFTASQPLPSAPAVVYYEEPETSNNPTLDCDRLTDKDEDSKKEHLLLMNNHIYLTLEEEEAVGNPKLNLGDELSDQSLDSAAEEQIDQPSQNPVNQMLENNPDTGQDASSEAFGCPSVGDVPANDPVQHVLDNP